MKKLILMGRVAAGKTTLTQALKGEQIHYCKTQYINYMDTIIDTPGEYTEVHTLAAALAVYSYEADVIGIISGIDKPDANVPLAERWLNNCGLKKEKIFYVSSYTREGLDTIIDYLNQE